MRRSRLLRKSPLRSKPKRVNRTDPARVAWKEQQAGYCQCGCQKFSMHLEHHHVIAAAHLRQLGREDVMWDPRNGMYLVERCHGDHTSAMRRIRVEFVPEAAARFALEVLGEGPAAEYFRRYYGCDESLRRAA